MFGTKTVLFVGGIHGAGKTTLCNRLAQKFNAVSVRQRHMLMEVGREHGYMAWDEVGPRHDALINEVAQRTVRRFLSVPARLMLFDCHYAIASEKALRLAGQPAERPYIPDLDARVVSALASHFRCVFLNLYARTDTVIERLIGRSPELAVDPFSSYERLEEQQHYEKAYFIELAQRLPHSFAALELENEAGQLESVIERLVEVLESDPATGNGGALA